MNETAEGLALAEALAGRRTSRPFGVYLHVPFCSTRCGYCDFNTYTATELGPGASREDYPRTLAAELAMAREVLPEAGPVDTVFFGGGTPTLLGAAALVGLLGHIRERFGLAPDAEVTTEANPDSIDAAGLARLREGGFTRVSFGVQSLSPHVLEVLDRTHTPGRSLAALAEARSAGFDHVSADLIYATPGETDDDLRASVASVLDAGVDHLSAYSLIVEPGTRLAARVARGELPSPDDDEAAERYAIVDEMASAAGLPWYEVSNWARPGGECRHNLGYWRGCDWWGAGPGAHAHVDGLRWWNVKHPAAYARDIDAGSLPVEGWERLGEVEQAVEAIMLAVRLSEGIEVTSQLAPHIDRLRAEGLVEEVSPERSDRAVLTLRGRLLADHIVRELTAAS